MNSGRDFGRWLQHRMDLRQVKPADLARLTNTTPGVISHWLSGDRRPTPESVTRTCRALDASIEEAFRVLGWFDEPTALTPAQADLIETIRRRNISDFVAKLALEQIVNLDEAIKSGAWVPAMEPRG